MISLDDLRLSGLSSVRERAGHRFFLGMDIVSMISLDHLRLSGLSSVRERAGHRFFLEWIQRTDRLIYE